MGKVILRFYVSDKLRGCPGDGDAAGPGTHSEPHCV